MEEAARQVLEMVHHYTWPKATRAAAEQLTYGADYFAIGPALTRLRLLESMSLSNRLGTRINNITPGHTPTPAYHTRTALCVPSFPDNRN